MSAEVASGPASHDDVLSSSVIGPVFWNAIHRVKSAEELVALARIFPCCECRGNFLMKEARLARESGARESCDTPLSYEEAVTFWMSACRDEHTGEDRTLQVTHRLHSRVNEALGRNPTWIPLETLRARIALEPLTAHTVALVLVSAVASLTRSSCNYDAEAARVCASETATFEVRCRGHALMYRTRVQALTRYIHLMRLRAEDLLKHGSRRTRSAWRHVAACLVELDACNAASAPASFAEEERIVQCWRTVLASHPPDPELSDELLTMLR